MNRFHHLIQSSRYLRIIGFGSSNTEHFLSGMHWLEILDIGIRQTRQTRNHVCINSGVGGDTTQLALARFDRDVAFYQPQIVLVTLGLNDANPIHGISTETFKRNTETIVSKIQDLDALPILQTYYACIPEQVNEQRYTAFCQNMDRVRDVAAEMDILLIDQFARWEHLRLNVPHLYEPLMEDAMHLNRHGNLLMGLELCSALGLDVGEDAPKFWAETRILQEKINSVALPSE